jgi:hypothetical protein
MMMVPLTKFSPTLTTVLKEMCAVVDAPFDLIDFKADGWFRRFSWTEEEETSFEKWLGDLLYTSKEARHDMLEYPHYTTKKRAREAAKWFVFMYGWVRHDNKTVAKKL